MFIWRRAGPVDRAGSLSRDLAILMKTLKLNSIHMRKEPAHLAEISLDLSVEQRLQS